MSLDRCHGAAVRGRELGAAAALQSWTRGLDRGPGALECAHEQALSVSVAGHRTRGAGSAGGSAETAVLGVPIPGVNVDGAHAGGGDRLVGVATARRLVIDLISRLRYDPRPLTASRPANSVEHRPPLPVQSNGNDG